MLTILSRLAREGYRRFDPFPVLPVLEPNLPGDMPQRENEIRHAHYLAETHHLPPIPSPGQLFVVRRMSFEMHSEGISRRWTIRKYSPLRSNRDRAHRPDLDVEGHACGHQEAAPDALLSRDLARDRPPTAESSRKTLFNTKKEGGR